jgi:hypothetical protein
VPQPNQASPPAARISVSYENDVAAGADVLLAVLQRVTPRNEIETPNRTDQTETT